MKQLKKIIIILPLLITIMLFLGDSIVFAQPKDSTGINENPITDSVLPIATIDSTLISRRTENVYQIFDSVLKNRRFYSETTSTPVVQQKKKNDQTREWVFYILIGISLYLGLLKALFSRYFSNLFRVFFHASLRQSQWTEQLAQAKLPSGLMFLFFSMVMGMFVYLIMTESKWIDGSSVYFISIFGMCIYVVYIIKYIVINLFGWLSGYEKDAQLYIFIVSVINQLLSIILLPLLFLMAFSGGRLHHFSFTLSLFFLSIAFLFRYLRAYASLRYQIKIGTLPFIIYILSIELLPILLMIKFVDRILPNIL